MAERKLFGTDGIRALANSAPLDAVTVMKIGQAAAKYFSRDNDRPVFVIGRDTRISGEILESALASGLASMGADVKLIGVVPTPAVAVMAQKFKAQAGVVITASHNPAEDNGIKFFSGDGYKLPDDVELQLEELILNDPLDTSSVTGDKVGRISRVNCDKVFCDFLAGGVEDNCLAGLKVVVDCANGAASGIAPQVLQLLGAEVIVVNAQPDGLNINANCGAMHPEVTAPLVLENNADFGVAFDGDADRLIMIDNEGQVVDGDITIYLLALAHKNDNRLAGDTVVVTHYTNLALDAALKEAGIQTARVDNGDRYVIQEMLRGGFVVGGEKSGHLILSMFNTTGDGVLAAIHFARMVKSSGKTLAELAGSLKLYPQLLDKVDVVEKIPFEKISGYPELADKISSELGEKGRLLVRYSGTQNVCRVMLEGPDEDKLKEYNEQVKACLMQAGK